MRRAAAEAADTCLLRRASHVQQAQQATQSLPATASASCGFSSQQQNEPNMHSCDLSAQRAPYLQTQHQPELQSMAAPAQRKAWDDKADEHAQSCGSLLHGACNSSTECALQPQTFQQAAPSRSSHKEAQPAVHDCVVSHTLASCNLSSAFVDGKASRTSLRGSVWLPQSSLLPNVHCAAAQKKGQKSSQKHTLSGVASHKSVRRSLRHQAMV